MTKGMGRVPDVGGDGADKKPRKRSWGRTKPCDRDPRGKWYAGKPTLKERLLAKIKVDENTGCWIWTAGKNPNGYGIISVARTSKSRLAHRVLYEIEKGPIPAGMGLCHRCDNPPCVNPDHMFPGTQIDNMRDCAAKGRMPIFLGEKTSNAKLTAAEVLEIRSIVGKTVRKIGEEYGISHCQVIQIRKGRHWAHLLPKEGTEA